MIWGVDGKNFYSSIGKGIMALNDRGEHDWVTQSIIDGLIFDHIEPFKETVYWDVDGKKLPIVNMGYKMVFKKGDLCQVQ